MMTTVNIPLREDVAERIKQYADTHQTTISRLAENFFSVITTQNFKEQKNTISPLVQSFSIDGIIVPDGFDYKQVLADSRNEKYL
jgi:hypothetical protein